jgi:hypothetical protein
LWSVEREWLGETAFIIAGGPSVAQADVDRIAGRRIIAVNSSYERAPFADFLFFADARWWGEHRARVKGFAGRIVTVSRQSSDARLLHLEKINPPPGLAKKPTQLAMRRTSLQAAINLAVHLGAGRIVLLGADMRSAADGRTLHHAPHRWPVRPGCWKQHMAELKLTVAPLKALGVEVINCSPVSLIDWWPKMSLDQVLNLAA